MVKTSDAKKTNVEIYSSKKTDPKIEVAKDKGFVSHSSETDYLDKQLELSAATAKTAEIQAWVSVIGALFLFLTLVATFWAAFSAYRSSKVASRAIGVSERNVRIAEESAIAATESVKVSQKLLEISQQSFEIQVRPLMAMTHFSILYFPQNSPPITGMLYARVRPCWQNYGGGPTKIARSWVGTFQRSTPLTDEDDLPPFAEGSEGFFPPGSKLEVGQVELTSWGIEQIESSSLYVYVFGYMEYQDLLEKSNVYRTEYCYQVTVDPHLVAGSANRNILFNMIGSRFKFT